MTYYERMQLLFWQKMAQADLARANRLEEELRILRNAVPMRRYFRHETPRRVPRLRVLRVRMT